MCIHVCPVAKSQHSDKYWYMTVIVSMSFSIQELSEELIGYYFKSLIINMGFEITTTTY